ncbi:hypothetical protein BACINT_00242 [Bacteroides intestinalis DSM 17393]|uniref:Uncharacterized protein n=1 Tax=Bacteroides intestinalis DSM 17393 TaxID=471870 RepID=B3C5Q9_9BACE|nr:hypothetical protein BACINT_00242 [Bacteroides intestinalis DSM 17393]
MAVNEEDDAQHDEQVEQVGYGTEPRGYFAHDFYDGRFVTPDAVVVGSVHLEVVGTGRHFRVHHRALPGVGGNPGIIVTPEAVSEAVLLQNVVIVRRETEAEVHLVVVQCNGGNGIAEHIVGAHGAMVDEEFGNNGLGLVCVVGHSLRVDNGETVSTPEVKQPVFALHGRQRIVHLSLRVFLLVKVEQVVMGYVIAVKPLIGAHPHVAVGVADRVDGVDIFLHTLLERGEGGGVGIKLH